MSTVLLGQVWPLQMPPTPKAVLISLADQANDQGVCWPAIPSIIKRTCYGRSAVITALKWLEDNALIEVDRSASKSNRYRITPENFTGDRSGDHHYVYCITHVPTGLFYIGLRSCTVDPARDDYWGSGKACEWLESVRGDCNKRVIAEHETREAAAQHESDLLHSYIEDPNCLNRRVSSPKQAMGNAPSLFGSPAGPSASRTVRQPNRPAGDGNGAAAEPGTVRQADPNRKGEPSGTTKKSPPQVLELNVDNLTADGLPRDVAVEFLALRKRKKATLTPLAWAGFKSEAAKAGWSLEDAVRKALARNWTGFEAKWVADESPAGGKRPTVDPDNWWKTPEGVEAKGAELGVTRGKTPQEAGSFEARVWAAAGEGPWWDDRKSTTYRIAKHLRDNAETPA